MARRKFFSVRVDLVVLGALVSILHGAIFLGVAVLVSQHGGSMAHIVDTQDQGEFVTLGYELVATGRFFYLYDTPETFRTIAYPAVMAGTFLLSGGWFWAPYILHAIFHGITAAATAWLAHAIGLARRWALATGALFGISSGTILLTVSGMGSDIMYTSLYIVAACMLWKYAETRLVRYALFVGVLAGVATLTRPIGILGTMPLIAGILFLTSGSIRERLRHSWRPTALAILAFVLVVSPWMARNERVAGHFSLSSLPVYNFVYYNVPMYLSFANQSVEEDERNAILARLGNPNLYTLRGYTYSDELSNEQISFLREHGFGYLAFHIYKMIPFFLGSSLNVAHVVVSTEAPALFIPLFPKVQENLTSKALAGDWRGVLANLQRYWIVTLERLVWAGIFALAFLSPFFARGQTRLFLIFACIIILANAFLTSPVFQPRFRVPAEPFIWIPAIYTAHALFAWLKARSRKKNMPQLAAPKKDAMLLLHE